MKLSDYIALAGVVVSALAIIVTILFGVHAIITSTKKYELAEQYKNELLTWYGYVVFTISKLQIRCEEKDRIEALRELSALIEVGRFYFPNILKRDSFGKEKPSPYRGYRHAALDFLVKIYEFAKNGETENYQEQLEEWEREFTSIVFDIVVPRNRIRKIKKYTYFKGPKKTSIEDYYWKKEYKN